MFPRIKLSYFDAAGRAEAARLAFFIGGIPFEDNRMQRDVIEHHKTEYPYGLLPILQVDDQVLAESTAIARYAGRLAGLYPTNDPLAALMADEVMMAIDEFGESFHHWFSETDPELKAAKKRTLADEIAPRYIRQIEDRLAKMQEHATFQDPSRLFVHELWLYTFLHDMLQSDWLPFIPNDIHKNCKHWLALENKVSSHPRVKEWYATHPVRPKKLKLTYFAFGGRAEPIRLAFHIGGIEFEDH